MATSVLKIDILADVKKAVDGIDNVGKKLDGFGAGLKKIAGLAAAAFAVGQIAQFAGEAVRAAEESAKVQKVTDQIIKSTGAAAGLTGQQVGDLATKLSNLTAVDDEIIQQGANLILTFKNVKKEGEGVDDVFGRATASAVDLAAAGFGDVAGNAKMLGKALNDPLTGLTSLSRAGVTFTEQQKQQIRALTETGDLLGAQKIILAEVESQVGGTAAASASAMDRIKVAFGNAMEQVGAALLPVIDQLLPVLTQLLDELLPAVLPVVDVFAEVAKTVIGALMPALRPLIPVIVSLASTIGQQLGKVITALAPYLPSLASAFGKLVAAVTPLIPPVVDLFLAFMPLLPPFIRMIDLVASLAGKLSSGLSPVISAVAKIIGGLASGIGWLQDKIVSVITWITKLISKLSSPILSGIGSIVSGIGSIFGRSVPTGYLGTRNATSPIYGRSVGNVTIVAGWGADPLTLGPQVVDVLNRYHRRNGGNWNPLGRTI